MVADTTDSRRSLIMDLCGLIERTFDEPASIELWKGDAIGLENICKALQEAASVLATTLPTTRPGARSILCLAEAVISLPPSVKPPSQRRLVPGSRRRLRVVDSGVPFRIPGTRNRY